VSVEILEVDLAAKAVFESIGELRSELQHTHSPRPGLE
jgi:hypothetical protein